MSEREKVAGFQVIHVTYQVNHIRQSSINATEMKGIASLADLVALGLDARSQRNSRRACSSRLLLLRCGRAYHELRRKSPPAAPSAKPSPSVSHHNVPLSGIAGVGASFMCNQQPAGCRPAAGTVASPRHEAGQEGRHAVGGRRRECRRWVQVEPTPHPEEGGWFREKQDVLKPIQMKNSRG